MTRFNKPALSAREQLELLIERGLKVHAERALRLLEVTTLFRLSPYMRPFQHPEDNAHSFKPGSPMPVRSVASASRITPGYFTYTMSTE